MFINYNIIEEESKSHINKREACECREFTRVQGQPE